MTAKNDPRNPGFKNTVLYGLRLAQHYSHSRYQLQILGVRNRGQGTRGYADLNRFIRIDLEVVLQKYSGKKAATLSTYSTWNSWRDSFTGLKSLDARSAGSSFARGKIGIDEDETLSLLFDAGISDG